MIAQLQYITQDDAQFSHVELCERACRAGVRWVQLRRKNVSPEEIREDALKCREITRKYAAKLILNDFPDLALEVGADGVHLGLEDPDTGEVRKQCPEGFIIGGTANTLEDILHHAANGVDYVGVGPFRYTQTKKKLSPILGLEGYQELSVQLNARGIVLPVIAIGGIVPEDVESLASAGVYGIAVSGCLTRAVNMKEMVEQINKDWRYGSIENWR